MDEQGERATLTKSWEKLNPPLNWHALLSDDDRSDWAAIHRFHALQTWNQSVGLRKKLALLIAAASWPVWAFLVACHCTRLAGRHVEGTTGIPRSQQFRDQLSLACFECISPVAYYLFRLYEPENMSRRHGYLHRYESKKPALLFKIVSRNPEQVSRLLCDKLLFHDRCVEHGIATPRVHLVVAGREGRGITGDVTRLPEANLFVKPRRGKGGQGVQAWNFTSPGDYENADGERLDREALLERLRADARGQALLVQERIDNHPELAVFCGQALATARIMTVINESERPEPVIAVFRMATADALVDNFHHGGLAASVDLKTGELGSAIAMSPFSERTDFHPGTRRSFAGERIPGWQRALRLAIRAHERFPGRTVLGWDIGFTAEGPVLVEGNSSPGVHVLQCASGDPLGESRLAQLVVYHLRRRSS